MATSGKGTGLVGYNVQAAVDAEHHLIVGHDVTNVGSDRAQLAPMGRMGLHAGEALRGSAGDLTGRTTNVTFCVNGPFRVVEPPGSRMFGA